MPKKLEAYKRPLWRKIIIIPLLPALIALWMIGWTLTQIGFQNTNGETKQRTVINRTTCQQLDETKIQDEEGQKIVYDSEILV